jgi:hypothetical protein
MDLTVEIDDLKAKLATVQQQLKESKEAPPKVIIKEKSPVRNQLMETVNLGTEINQTQISEVVPL